MNLILGIAIPFLGTSIGAMMVFFMKDHLSGKIEKLLLGFAGGVMIAASIWSLIIPSIEMAEMQNIISWVPTSIGFILGISFLLLVDYLYPYFEKRIIKAAKSSKLKKIAMLVFSVTVHNIPEGMAVGIVFANALNGCSDTTIASAFILALGMAVQNFPEGAIISMPLKSSGVSKIKSFLYGVLSGIVEPIAAIITIILFTAIKTALPYLLAFSAGAMIYVVVDELIPELKNEEESKIGLIGITFGFLLMMILDVTLG